MTAAAPPQTEIDHAATAWPDSDVLVVDSHTLEDLEIFASEASQTSLFDLCNLTRTDGGARVLRRRMASPWSNPGRIRSTQESLSFILAQRGAFSKLPQAYTTGRVERYMHEVLPVVRQEKLLSFSLGAFALWADDDSRYIKILTGVRFTRELVQALRGFLGQPELESPLGEIAPLLMEMRALLDRPGLARLPGQGARSWFWNILRFDQVFRLREKAATLRLVALVYEVDTLIAMADTTSGRGFVLPRIENGPPRVRAEGLVHPFVGNPVANPVELDQQHQLLFLTGPNMAGKTTYLRAFAIALYLAHLGMGVPARSFDYLLHAGVSSQRLGMRVLREEGIFELFDWSTTAD